MKAASKMATTTVWALLTIQVETSTTENGENAINTAKASESNLMALF